jgi:adenosylhomocysteine nucleosidase
VSQILFNDPCILFALRRESGPFRREFRPQQSFPGAPCWARFCGPAWLTVLLVETGMGQANVSTALDWLLSEPSFEGVPYRPQLLLFAGFAGALTESLRVGDIVLAEEVVDTSGGRWRTTWPTPFPEGDWTPPLHRGRLLTVDTLCGGAKDKRDLRTQFQADAVEMESAVFAARCTEAAIPFGCVRTISDDLSTSLAPELASLLSGGTVSPWRFLLLLARHPGLLPQLLRLARDTRRSAEQLGMALGELLTLTIDQ